MTELNEQIKKVRESIDLFEKIQNSRTVAVRIDMDSYKY